VTTADPPTADPPAADWYPDPYGRHERRYFDGARWTERVATRGRQAVDPAEGVPKVPTVHRSTGKVQRDVSRAGLAGAVLHDDA